MYAKARRGEIKDFTGIDDPYEAPDDPDISLDTVSYSVEDNASKILELLVGQGFILDSNLEWLILVTVLIDTLEIANLTIGDINKSVNYSVTW